MGKVELCLSFKVGPIWSANGHLLFRCFPTCLRNREVRKQDEAEPLDLETLFDKEKFCLRILLKLVSENNSTHLNDSSGEHAEMPR